MVKVLVIKFSFLKLVFSYGSLSKKVKTRKPKMGDGCCKTEVPPCPHRRNELTGMRRIRWGARKFCTRDLLSI